MKEFFATYPLFAWSLVSTMLALVIVASLWEKIRWWAFNTWVSFPVVGRIARLQKDATADTACPGWYTGERVLCQEYKDFAHMQDEHDYNEKVTYLTKAGDNGRQRMPRWIWLLTVSMVVVEAMGFSYVLAGYTIPGASENLQQTGAIGIAFLISVILVAFTHLAGHELYRSGRIRNARQTWVQEGRTQKLLTATIPLARPQSVDDHLPPYTQLCNRVGASQPSYHFSIATVAIVLLIAVGATYVRGQVLEKELEARVVSTIGAIDRGGDSLDMSDANVALPQADAQANDAADKKAVNDEADIDRHGGWATFIILAFVFVFLQLLGVIFGHRWGFAGENSAQAYDDIGGGRFSSYAAVRNHYKRIADTAQAKLSVLQQKMIERNSEMGTAGQFLTKTFANFMQETRIAEQIERGQERAHAASIAAAVATPSPSLAPVVAAASTDLRSVMAKLDALHEDKAAKMELIGSLSPALQGEVTAALKSRKDDQARKALAQELEGLL